jgi:hypothetical protein
MTLPSIRRSELTERELICLIIDDSTLSRWFMQEMNEWPVTYFVIVTDIASIILKGSY